MLLGRGFHVVALGERRKHSVCASAISGISDVGAKPSERRREDGVRLGRAVGRLVELREREGGAQFEAARSLSFRDGDGGAVMACRRARDRRTCAHEQDFAAGPMQFCFECAVAQAIRRRQRFVEGGYGMYRIALPRPRPRPI